MCPQPPRTPGDRSNQMLTVGLPKPEFIAREAHRLVMRYVQLSMPHRRTQAGSQSPEAFVKRSVVTLEVLAFALGLAEAARELGIRGVGTTPERMRKLFDTALASSGLRPESLVEAVRTLEVKEPLVGQAEFERIIEEQGTRLPALGATVLKFCPINDLVAMAHAQGLFEHAHRMQRAYSQLAAVTRRNQDPQNHLLHVVGHAYSEGRLCVQEVAEILHCDTPDAVALLENHGFNRPPERIALTEDARSRILREVRAERNARGGRPVMDPTFVRREVIATQRTEGIDARPWLTTSRS